MEGFLLTKQPASTDRVGDSLERPEDFPFRVLLRVPEATTIPIFALGVEAQREEVERKLIRSTVEALARIVSGNLSRALPGRYGDHRLLNVRAWRSTRLGSHSLTRLRQRHSSTIILVLAFLGSRSGSKQSSGTARRSSKQPQLGVGEGRSPAPRSSLSMLP